jgi:hypothetical protein
LSLSFFGVLAAAFVRSSLLRCHFDLLRKQGTTISYVCEILVEVLVRDNVLLRSC